MSFFDTTACRSGHHCRTCRDRAAGRSFRAAISTRFSLPTDFDCPHGRRWSIADQPAAPPVTSQRSTPAIATPPSAPDPAAIAEVQRRFAVCRACEHSRDDGFACALHPGCCFGRLRSDLTNACPAGRW